MHVYQIYDVSFQHFPRNCLNNEMRVIWHPSYCKYWINWPRLGNLDRDLTRSWLPQILHTGLAQLYRSTIPNRNSVISMRINSKFICLSVYLTHMRYRTANRVIGQEVLAFSILGYKTIRMGEQCCILKSNHCSLIWLRSAGNTFPLVNKEGKYSSEMNMVALASHLHLTLSLTFETTDTEPPRICQLGTINRSCHFNVWCP